MPHRYPQEAVTRDGRRLLIRPFGRGDAGALYAFYRSLPVADRRFAWDRVDDPGLIDGWAESLDYDRVFPLLALDGTRIVAEATLKRRDRGPLRLVARVHWFIAPEFRGVGLGMLLVNHLVSIARERGLRHLTCMLISDLEAEAIRVLGELGFESTTFPGYGTDPDGDQHDMTKMVMKL